MLRRCLAITGLLALGLITSACDLLEPCALGEVGVKNTTLDRKWEISAVNGAPIPAQGLNIPGKTDRLVFGQLLFQTTRQFGKCPSKTSSVSTRIHDEGRVIAVYNIVTEAGVSKGTMTYAGSFKYDHASGAVTLNADKGSVDGTRLADEMTFAKTLPVLGTYTVKFTKVN